MDDLHARMLAAVLGGQGLDGVAEVAAAEAGGQVAILLPARGLAGVAPAQRELDELMAYVGERVRGADGEPPEPVALEAPVEAGGEPIGAVLLLGNPNGSVALDRTEILRTAAVASLTEVAVIAARDELTEELRATLLEDLRAGGGIARAELMRRAARLGCDLTRGAVVIVAELERLLPSRGAALIDSEWRGALAEPLEGRIYGILPASGGDEAPERTMKAAGALVRRLRKHGGAAHSSFCADPEGLPDALREAELVLEVTARDERIAERVGTGSADSVYRLLFRALVSNPDEVRRFYEDTVASLVDYDRQYRTDLVGTLEAYLDNDCNMNATARAIFAHRHTVAYRLDRIRQMTSMDPTVTDDRERLGLGIKAYRLLAPSLPR